MKKVLVLTSKSESILRFICENNPKIFIKKQDDIKGTIEFKSISSTEAKIDIGFIYLWKNYSIKFKIS